MAYCEKCGAALGEEDKFCPVCGAVIGYNAGFENNVDEEDIKKNKALAFLAYWGFLVLVPFFVARKSKFARFHTNQGIMCVFTGFLGGLIAAAISMVPGMTVLGEFLSGIISLTVLVFEVMGMVNALQGKYKELPLIGKVKLLK